MNQMNIQQNNTQNYPISCDTSSGGYFVCENVSNLLNSQFVFMLQDNINNTPFQTLNILSTNFVVQHMRDLVRRDLLPRRALVDTHHRNANGPWGVTNAEAQIRVICALILPFLHVVHNFGHAEENISRERL